MRRSVVLCLAILVASPAARAADPREQQLAQALFDEARQLMEQKRYSEACPKLAESQRLDPGGGTLLNLALCHEKEGKIATAQAEYGDALAISVKDGRKDRQDLARERLAAIEPKIARISVVVPPGSDVEGLEVKLDGLVLRRAAWGVLAPADPGFHHVEATAPGRQGWSLDVPLDPSEKKNVRVPPLAGNGAPPPPPQPPPPTAAPPPTVYVSGASHGNPLFYASIGVAVVGYLGSAITGGLAISANSDAKSGCADDRHFCRDQSSLDAASRARTMAWISTAGAVVGTLGVVGIFFFPSSVRSSAQVGFAPEPGGGTVRLRASF